MRKIEEVLTPKFFNGESATISNTTVKDGEMFLFGNKIAWIRGNQIYFSMCGWNTHTTRSRLNALGIRISCVKGEPVWNGQVINEYEIYKQEI